MSEENKVSDGGPAFPLPLGGETSEGMQGISIRDWFAGQCLPILIDLSQRGMLKDEDLPDGLAREIVASQAYVIADAMLKARSK